RRPVGRGRVRDAPPRPRRRAGQPGLPYRQGPRTWAGLPPGRRPGRGGLGRHPRARRPRAPPPDPHAPAEALATAQAEALAEGAGSLLMAMDGVVVSEASVGESEPLVGAELVRQTPDPGRHGESLGVPVHGGPGVAGDPRAFAEPVECP